MTTRLKIIIGQTQQGKGVGFDLNALITTRALIQANSGAGKSYLLRALMEQLFPQIQIICIDPEGDFASLREKFPFVLVGKDGDAAADVRTAGLLAERLLEMNASAICDLYEMKEADRHLWLKNFLNAMINVPKKLWHPVIVIIDEAQMFCPEGKGEAPASQAVKDLCTRGRKRGFCAVLATQSLADLNKGATKMLLNRLVGGTFEDVDVKRSLDLLSVLPEDKRAISHQMRTMEPGWFFAFGRAISKERILFKSRKAETTHASAGSGKHSATPPPPPEKVRELLPRLADLPKEAADRAQTVDDLKKQLRAATLELAAAKKGLAAGSAAKPAQQAGMKEADLKRAIAEALKPWHKFAHDCARAHRLLKDNLERIAKIASDSAQIFPAIVEVPKGIPELKPAAFVLSREAHAEIARAKYPPPMVSVRPPAVPPRAEVNGEGSARTPRKKRKKAMEMLGYLAQWATIGGLTKSQLASMAGLRVSTGNFRDRLSELRTAGYMIEKGEELFATEEGIAAAGVDLPPAPSSTEEVLGIWKSRIRGKAYQILEELVRHGGEPVSKDDLATAVNLVAATGNFRDRLSELRTARLIVDAGSGTVAANKETLFLEGVYA